jgi:hypothetical protein
LAWDCLALDFDQRCAYSLTHTYRLGRKSMEVDHFNPHKKNDIIQEYKNLFPASHHCNNAKRNRWPTNKDQRLGIRFLNCCKETDYGVHIFEDPDTHELVGVTTEGIYHVRNCDLNASQFVNERVERAELWNLLEADSLQIKKGLSLPQAVIDTMKAMAEKMIPKIPYLSGDALEKQRARKKALAAI